MSDQDKVEALAWKMAQAFYQDCCPRTARPYAELLLEARELLAQADSVLSYTLATISAGNRVVNESEWVGIHRGRADSSYRQMVGLRAKGADLHGRLESL